MHATPLTAAEALILLNPNKPQGHEALKLALTELLARRMITLHHEEHKGFLGIVRKSSFIQLAHDALQRLPGKTPLYTVLKTLTTGGASGSDSAAMEQVVRQAREVFGSDLSDFPKKHILPALVERGLLETCIEKMLWIFPVTRYCYTMQGAATKQRLEAQMLQAHSLPTLLESDPAQAAALVFSLGSAILLVGEVKSQYAHLSKILGEQQSGIDRMPLYYDSVENTTKLDIPSQSAFGEGFLDFDFDFDFDVLDRTLDMFDNSFDSSADSGADSGDSGGN